MKHTEGPWEVERFNDSQPPYLIAPPKGIYVICTFNHERVRHLPREEQEANAVLIAAAPDLLEACKHAAQFIRNGVELGYIRLPDKGDPALDTLPMIEKALKKTGGTL